MGQKCKNLPCSQSRGAEPDTSFEYSKFIKNGVLKVPVNMLSRELLINILDLLLVHIETVKDQHTGLDEAQGCGVIPTKSGIGGEIPTKSGIGGEIPTKSGIRGEIPKNLSGR